MAPVFASPPDLKMHKQMPSFLLFAMGKQNMSKSKPNGRVSGSMPDYFPSNSLPTISGLEEGSMPKMVPGVDPKASETAAMIRQELVALREDLKSHFTSLIDEKLEPIWQHLSSLTTTIQEVSSTARAAYDMGKSQEFRIKEMQVTEGVLKERMAWLETKTRAMKFCGLPEIPELNSTLTLALVTWLVASVRSKIR